MQPRVGYIHREVRRAGSRRNTLKNQGLCPRRAGLCRAGPLPPMRAPHAPSRGRGPDRYAACLPSSYRERRVSRRQRSYARAAPVSTPSAPNSSSIEGRKSYAEANAQLVELARELSERRPRLSLREISAALASEGFTTRRSVFGFTSGVDAGALDLGPNCFQGISKALRMKGGYRACRPPSQAFQGATFVHTFGKPNEGTSA
jgi:hypothetical protein